MKRPGTRPILYTHFATSIQTTHELAKLRFRTKKLRNHDATVVARKKTQFAVPGLSQLFTFMTP